MALEKSRPVKGQPISAEDVLPEKVTWLWRERIPRRMITIVGGRPDQGKGLFCTRVAADVSRMRVTDPVTGEERYGKVLYSAIEDSHGLMTKPRLVAAGARTKGIDLWRFQIPAMFTELEAQLRNGVDLLIMDPLAAHLSHGVSRHSDNIRTVLNPLTEIIEETGTAVIIVEHVLKRVPQSGHPLAAIGGSGSGIVAASRMAYLFGVDPKDYDRRYLCPVKHNICEKPMALTFEVDTNEVEPVGEVPFLLFDPNNGEVEFDPRRFLEVAREGVIGRPPDKKAAASEWLANYLYAAYCAGKPKVPAGLVVEDAKQFGIASKTMRRAAQDMDVVFDPPGGGRSCTWEIGNELADTLDEANGRGIYAQVADVGESPVSADDTMMLDDDDFSQLLGGDHA